MKTNLCLTMVLAAVAAWPATTLSQNLNPASGSTTLPTDHRAEGFIMVDNRIHVVSRGVARPLEQEVILRITPNGIVGFDQLPRTITQNGMMTLDGRIVAAPEVAVMPPRIMAEPDPAIDRRFAPGNVVWGTNISGLAPSRSSTVNQSSGPRYISAKKSSPSKARRSTTVSKSTAGKSTGKTTAAKQPAAKSPPVSLPPFNDEVIPLPDLGFEPDQTLSPKIDATSTMLYMTAGSEPAWTPESQSIRASLENGLNKEALLKLPASVVDSEIEPEAPAESPKQ